MRKTHRTWLLAVVAAVSMSAGAWGQEKGAGASRGEGLTPFVSALTQSWGRIDLDGNGEITSAEVEAAVRDPEIRGDAAAVVGSLKLVTRSKGDEAPKLTREYFAGYNAGAKGIKRESGDAAMDATTDPDRQGDGAGGNSQRGSAAAINWDRYFAAGKARIARFSGTEHWVPGNFVVENAKQGPLGDCFFVATISSMAWRDPERLARLVTRKSDGSFEAHFPGAEPFRFPALTETQLAISGTTPGGGAWLAVMEQAFGRYRSKIRGGSVDVEGTDILRWGGDSAPTIQALTGNKTRRISFPKTAEEREAQAEKVLADLRAEIKRAVAARRLITIGMQPLKTAPTVTVKNPDGSESKKPAGTLPKIPRGIVTNHVYMLVSYDEATDTVEVWNPHGNTFKPKGEPGLVNGFETEKGRFKLKLGEAYRFYTSMTFETGEKVVSPNARAGGEE